MPVKTRSDGRLAEVFRESRFTFVDIGARGGLPPHWAPHGPVLNVVAFEPDPDEAERLVALIEAAGAQTQVVPSAVWDTAGRKTLHLTRSPGCSSLFPPRVEYLRQFPHVDRFDVMSRVGVETQPLDEVEAVRGTPGARFIKIDAQGGALPVLMGATRTLDSVVGLELEVELVPIYDGEALFGEVDVFVRGREFELIDLRPTYWRRTTARAVPGTRGQLIFGDALYMLSPQTLAARVAGLPAEAARHLYASALLACQVYRLDDWLFAYAEAVSALSAPAARLLTDLVPQRRRRAPIPAFPYQHRLGSWLKDLGDNLIEAGHVWAIAEQRLANKPRNTRTLTSWLMRRASRS